MALPKKKISKSRRDLRRANDRLKPVGYHECANCGEMKLPHHVCRACGYYDGREVVRAGSAGSQ